MGESYKNAVEEWKKINSNIGNKIYTLSLTVIGAIYIVSEKYGVGRLLIIALVCLVFTIAANLLNNIFGAKHYERFLDKKIYRLDFNSSKLGVWANRFFWGSIALFFISAVFFIIALIQIIIVKIST